MNHRLWNPKQLGNKKMTEFKTWAILEILGHRRLGGYLSEEEIAAVKMLRIDMPVDAESSVTQYYHPNSVYSISPCSEEIARHFAIRHQTRPLNTWELPRLEQEEPEEDCTNSEDDRDDEPPF